MKWGPGMSRIELLQAMPVFGGVRAETLTFLLELSSTVAVAPGEFFFRENDEGQSMYVLEAGSAAVVKNWDGRQYLLNHLAKGDCFGEMALMDMRHRSASIVAVEACHAIELPAASLYALYEKDLQQFDPGSHAGPARFIRSRNCGPWPRRRPSPSGP